ncbi:alpha-galactosidase A isoform X2 [Bombyx mori]|uniref:alpha-galactosidase A isoform X2 n=1 Tax=Bombyx mori TaxID=7091 RepID=UPI000640B68E
MPDCNNIVRAMFFISLFGYARVLENGLVRTPPMGWMSWGYYMCGADCEQNPDKCLDEKLILSVADTFYNEGYQEAGFEYIIIDDCWSEHHRDRDGRLVPDSLRFPNGMKYISDYIHSRNLKFGMYTNVADVTCMRYQGSKGHFKVDADTFAQWGVDYIKVDGCFVGEQYLNNAYIHFGGYLNKTNRPMVYSCSWPYYIEFIHNKKPDYPTISKHCNLWRNYHDVVTSWSAVKNIIQHYEDEYSGLEKYHGPGHWNDPDMIDYITLWVKPRMPRKGDIYPSYSLALVNVSGQKRTITVRPSNYGLNCTDGYSVMDIFSKRFLKNITFEDSIDVTVPSEDVILYTLFPL